MQVSQLNAVKREKAGKGASRAKRREGFVPAVIYGDKKEPLIIALEEKVIVAEMAKKGLWTRQFNIVVDGQNNHVLCQDIQKHPVSSRPMHVDFLRISKDAELTLDIPVRFENEATCPGIKLGGILNVVHRTLEAKCKADNIPEAFVIDLSKVEMGTSITAFSIELPAGVKLAATEDFTVATIVASQMSDSSDAATTEAK
ncbi:MAG: 50S ribosomal protein L25/general stress protein Ctc [Alphaproteobacteria bacterium]|nr:50S ribosomal protein L25/general stress protein Ctc [Alphaproteobacteria bacterium]